MNTVLLTTLLALSRPMMGPIPEPVPAPPVHDLGPFIRSEKWEVKNPGHDRYLRKKRRKKDRETWRQ